MYWVTQIAALTQILAFAGISMAAKDPIEPQDPQSTKECSLLSRDYYRFREDLHRQMDATPRRGQQVMAGQCCKAENPGNFLFCKTYQSVAPLWEELHCVEIRQRKALDRCMEKVKVRRDRVRNEANRGQRKGENSEQVRRSENAEFVNDYLTAMGRTSELVSNSNQVVLLHHEAQKWYSRAAAIPELLHYQYLAKQYAHFGLPKENIPDLVQKATNKVANYAFTDSLIRSLVTDNLSTIGVAHDRVFEAFDHASEEISAFSQASSAGYQRSRLVQSLPNDSNNSQTCLQNYFKEIEECNKSTKSDFANALRICKERIEPKYRSCF